MPEDLNNPNPQRTEPAVQPQTDAEVSDERAELAGPESNAPSANEVEAEADLGQNAEGEIAEIISNPETVKAVLEFLAEKKIDWSDVTITEGMWDWSEGSDIAHIELNDDSADYFVSPDSDTTYRMAIALVKNDLNEEAGIFNTDFIRSHINEERLRQTLMSDVEEQIRENDTEPVGNEEGAEVGALDEEEVTRRAEQELSDPIQYLIDIFGQEDGLKQAIDIGGIDIEAAAEDAVGADGEGHFLSTYDGEVRDLSGGGQYWRHN